MTYQEFWQRLTPLYDDNEAKAIARMVLDIRFGLSLTDIYMGKVSELSANNALLLEKMAKRLEKGEPVQYVLGEAEFAGRIYKVREGVLIPRPETAELCEWMIGGERGERREERGERREERGERREEREERKEEREGKPLRILDVGTGSGCIAITLALACPRAEVTAWDISPQALDTARENARRLGAAITVEEQDIRTPRLASDTSFNLIVSNPPYICEREKAFMEENVLEHEPPLALFVPDDDPLLFYRLIARFAVRHLAADGWLYFEINPLYAGEMRAMLAEEGFTDVASRPDQFGKERMMRARLATSPSQPTQT